MRNQSRKRLTEVDLARAFVPGRLARHWLATAYERLLPRTRFARGPELRRQPPLVQEEYRWAQ